MKVYTKTGDKGSTSIIGDTRSKADIRVASYGSVDEALAFIGDVLTLTNLPKKTREELYLITDKLFDLNRALATLNKTNYITEEDIVYLETSIDYMDSKLMPLTNFILPIGNEVYTKLNIVRTLIRKAERHTVELAQSEDVDLLIIKYLNRLSDYFFVACRYANYCNKQKEVTKKFK